MIALLLLIAASETPPELVAEPVVVTATRTPGSPGTSAQEVRVMDGDVLRMAKAPDEALRGAPEFAAFRRSSSLVADPTSQGASLRGVGPSGVSRALVLEDGVPATDPFGGWIYWRALSRLAPARIERLVGGGSALYGSAALGGVLQFVSAPIDDRVEALVEGGSFGTGAGAALWSKRVGSFGLSADVDALATGGYRIVREPGPIDQPASANHLRGALRGEMQLSENTTLWVRGAGFGEDQNGGTTFTDASVRMATASTGAHLQRGNAVLDFRLFGRAEEFDQRRARIPKGRPTEELSAVQTVPARDLGGSATAAIPIADHLLVAGIDGRAVHGISNETLIPPSGSPPSAVASRVAGGDQRLLGAFASDEWRIAPAVRLSGTLRVDGVWNVHGSRSEETVGGAATEVSFPSRSNVQLSPRLGLLVRPVEPLTLRASAYGAFRAPTLNELYRPFQVGAVRTEANEALEAETLRGAEAGFEIAHGPVSLRGIAFANLLDNPIANVTVGAPTDNHAKRQNLGRARIRGIESGLHVEPRRGIAFDAQYAYVEPVVVEADDVREVVGKDLVQDPRHRLMVGAQALLFERTNLGVQVRWTNGQYEDDRNTVTLPGYAVVDVHVSQALGKNWEALLAIENLLGRDYLVSKQGGLDLLGQPRFVRIGVAYHVH
ncbi:MAG: TonB-dependent receptor [Myxococcales bacterium]